MVKWWGSRNGEKSTSPLRMPINIGVDTSGCDVLDPLSQERALGLYDNILTLYKVNLITGEVDSIYLAPRLEETVKRCQFQYKETFWRPAGLQSWVGEGCLRNQGFPLWGRSPSRGSQSCEPPSAGLQEGFSKWRGNRDLLTFRFLPTLRPFYDFIHV